MSSSYFTLPDFKAGKADFHIHSVMSDGVATIKEILDHVNNYTDLDVISITDHDTMANWELVQKWMHKKDYRFKVIPGQEITTLGGHLIALNIRKEIAKHRSLHETILEIHRQGGLAIIPHPLGWITSGVTKRDIMHLAKHTSGDFYLDAIELFNSSPAGRQGQRKAIELNRKVLKVAEVGSSDAHNLSLIGKCHTLFPGSTPEDLIRAIKEKKTIASGSFMSIRDTLKLMKERNSLYRRVYKKYLRHRIRKLPLLNRKKKAAKIFP